MLQRVVEACKQTPCDYISLTLTLTMRNGPMKMFFRLKGMAMSLSYYSMWQPKVVHVLFARGPLNAMKLGYEHNFRTPSMSYLIAMRSST